MQNEQRSLGKKSRVTDQLFNQLLQRIVTNHWGPGQRLPSERNLANRLGVSRNSIREALRALEIMGLLDVRHGDGSFVKHVDVSAILSPIILVLAQKRGFLREVIDFRCIIEPPISCLAAERATTDDLARLKGIMRQYEDLVRRQRSAVSEDLQFHRALALATKNEVVTKTIEIMLAILFRCQDLWKCERQVDSARAHRRLVSAIEDRDGRLAASIMKEHLVTIRACI